MADEQMVKGIIDVPRTDVMLMLESGYLFMELGKNKEAEEVFDGLCAMFPSNDVPHVALGNLYFSQGKFSPALKAQEKAVACRPDSATAHAGVAEALFFLKRFDEALAAADQAIGLDVDGSAGQFAASLKEAHELGIFG